MRITLPYLPSEPVPFLDEGPTPSTRRRRRTALRSEFKSEQRLWKLRATAASPTFESIELIAFDVRRAFAIPTLMACLSELLYLFDTGALGKAIRLPSTG
jgi:hypothetical protein